MDERTGDLLEPAIQSEAAPFHKEAPSIVVTEGQPSLPTGELRIADSELPASMRVASLSSVPHRSSEAEIISSYQASVEQYLGKRSELFGQERENKMPMVIKKVGKVTKNFTRLIGDLLFRARRDTRSEELQKSHLKATVLGRENFLSSETFNTLYKIERNRPLLASFMDQELFREANCTQFLKIEGTTLDQFHAIVESMGHNPQAFLSDDRGENGGRIAIDNRLINGTHPYLSAEDPDYAQEMRHWQRVLSRAPEWTPMSRWMMSRTHGVIYQLKNEDQKDVLLIPIHVDPKNAVSFAGEMLGNRSPDQKGALSYHRMAISGDSSYVGTGLYSLGCRMFLDLLTRSREQGIVGAVTIDGSQADLDQINAEDSIVRGDRQTWMLKKMLSQPKKV